MRAFYFTNTNLSLCYTLNSFPVVIISQYKTNAERWYKASCFRSLIDLFCWWAITKFILHTYQCFEFLIYFWWAIAFIAIWFSNFICLIIYLATWQCSSFSSSSVLMGHSWWSSGTLYMWCWKWNLGWSYAKLVSYCTIPLMLLYIFLNSFVNYLNINCVFKM